MSTIGDPRKAGEPGPAGDQRQAGESGPAGDPRPAGAGEVPQQTAKPKSARKTAKSDG